MKKKILFFVSLLLVSQYLMAEDGRSIINNILTTWVIPFVSFLLTVNFANQVYHNMDGLRGKNGASQSEAWTEVGKAAAYILCAVALWILVSQKASSISITV